MKITEKINRKYEIIVIGGSAGSLSVLSKMIPTLPKYFSFPVVLVIHRQRNLEIKIEDFFQTYSNILVKEADEKEKIHPGTIYIAPADYHLLIEQDKTFSLDYAPKINSCRPSIDVTFECVAEIYKEKSVGIILTGANEDGAYGLSLIKKYGGLTIVEDPATAEISVMPQAAIFSSQVDYVLPSYKINELLVLLDNYNKIN